MSDHDERVISLFKRAIDVPNFGWTFGNAAAVPVHRADCRCEQCQRMITKPPAFEPLPFDDLPAEERGE